MARGRAQINRKAAARKYGTPHQRRRNLTRLGPIGTTLGQTAAAEVRASQRRQREAGEVFARIQARRAERKSASQASEGEPSEANPSV